MADPEYRGAGGILDLMAYTVIQVHLAKEAQRVGAPPHWIESSFRRNS